MLRISVGLMLALSLAAAQSFGVYPEPSLFQPPIRTLVPGETLTVNFQQGSWSRVTLTDGRIGWVVSARLSTARGRAVVVRPASKQPGSSRNREFLTALGVTNAAWLPGVALCFGALGWSFSDWDPFHGGKWLPQCGDNSAQVLPVMFCSGLGLMAAAPAAAALAVSRLHDERSGKRLAGSWAIASLAAAVGLVMGYSLDSASNGRLMGIPTWSLTTAGCALGAVWGYDITSRTETGSWDALRRLAPPSIALQPASDHRAPAVVLQPLTYRF